MQASRSGRLPAGRLIAAAIVAAVLLIVVGSIKQDNGGGGDFVDDMGDPIRLESDPMRIITLTPALTEMVFALDRGDRIVGCDQVSDYPEGADNITRVSSWQGVDLEKVVSVQPDLVLLDKTLDYSDSNFEALKGVGLTVYRIYPRTAADVLKNIGEIGALLGAEEEARTLLSDLGGRMGQVTDRTSSLEGEERPVILHIAFYDGSSDPWVSTDSTFSGDLIRISGGKNAVHDGKGIMVQVSIEKLIDADPDIILTSQSSKWPSTAREEIMGDPRWKDISAVKEGRVHDIESDWVDRTGPRCINGLEAINLRVMELLEGESG